MSINNYERERYSLCLVHAEHGGTRAYCKYFRVADFDPEENPNELAPAIVQADVTTFEDAQANPDHLYNPSAAHYHDSRESDFYLFQWKLHPENLGKQLTWSYHDSARLLVYKEPKEVIVLEGCNGEGDLRRAISEGIPFEGKTTTVFYIAYEKQKNTMLAIRCEKRAFLFTDGKIKLPVAMANVRETVLSAPRVVLNNYDIIESPHPATGYRKIYAKLDEIDADGSVLLRTLDYYAADYVKWFIRKESIHATKSDKRRLSHIIKVALSKPDALEAYLGAKASEGEVDSLKRAIQGIISEEEDSSRELFRNVLLEDDDFRQECVAQAMRESEGVLSERRAEIDAVQKQLDDLRGFIELARTELDQMKDEKAAEEKEYLHITTETERLRQEQDVVMAELQENIALRLGLRTVASPSTGGSPGTADFSIDEGAPIECEESDEAFDEVLAHNMKRLGLTSVSGSSEDERSIAALGVEGALTITRVLAMPQPVAGVMADALGGALGGKRAKRVRVPSDCRDVGGLLRQLDGPGVVLVENVIDSVNEGMLNALLFRELAPIIVLPFMSHESARLVASEAWERMFLPCVESLVFCPMLAKGDGLKRMSRAYKPCVVAVDNALEGAASIKSDLPKLGVSDGVALAASTVLQAVTDFLEDDPVEPFVSQYIAISSVRDGGGADKLAAWSEGDVGLKCLIKKLGIDES